MKDLNRSLCLAFFVLASCVGGGGLAMEKKTAAKDTKKTAQPMPSMAHVMRQGDQMVIMKDGKTMVMGKDMTMKDGSKVMTDGMVAGKDGSRSMLAEGDMIMMDGTRLNRYNLKEGDITMRDGQMMQMHNGKTSPLTENITAKDGSKIMKDGNVMLRDGARMMMRDGDTVTMDGNMVKYDTRKEIKEMRNEAKAAAKKAD